MVMVLEACVAADAVCPPDISAEAGSDVGATSAQPSSCTGGRSPWCVTVILESNEPSAPPLARVLAVEEIAIVQAAWWRLRSMSAEFVP